MAKQFDLGADKEISFPSYAFSRPYKSKKLPAHKLHDRPEKNLYTSQDLLVRCVFLDGPLSVPVRDIEPAINFGGQPYRQYIQVQLAVNEVPDIFCAEFRIDQQLSGEVVG